MGDPASGRARAAPDRAGRDVSDTPPTPESPQASTAAWRPGTTSRAGAASGASPGPGRVARERCRGVDLHLGQEVPRVDQRDADGLPTGLRRGRASQHEEGVLVVARGPMPAGQGPSSADERGLSDVALTAPGAARWARCQSASGRSRLALMAVVSSTACGPPVHDAQAAYDERAIAVDGQEQAHHESGRCVLEDDLDAVSLRVVLHEGRRGRPCRAGLPGSRRCSR